MQQIIKQIARQNNVSVEEVKSEIAAAIQMGMRCPDTKVQQQWNAIPKKQKIPTPEEVIAYMIAQIAETEQIAALSGAPPVPFELAAK